jgi:predicted MPP superfamily phosphohydrolase
MTFGQKKIMIPYLFIALLIGVFVTAFWHGIVVKTYNISSDKVKASVKIAVIADLHDCYFGKNQEGLIKAIRNQEPDMILLVGDIADDRKPHDAVEELLSVIGSKYPCFYVSGNHEIWSGHANQIKDMIRSYGVTVLEGETKVLSIDGQKIQVSGLDDPEAFHPRYRTEHTKGESFYDQLHNCKTQREESYYSVLLSHRPELIDEYVESGYDLIVSGHAHGGQFRIPFILNGFYAPHQGFFPKYTGGCYPLNEAFLVVSRGLSKSILLRFFNPPELVIVNLKGRFSINNK